MNINESCKILQIDISQITYKVVKKQYYKLALLSHPDKIHTTNYEFSFNTIKLAHDTLINYLDSKQSISNNDSQISNIIIILEYIFEIIYYKYNNTSKIIDFVNKLSPHELNEVKIFLNNIKNILPKNIYNYLYATDLSNNYFYTDTITLNPSLYDLLEHNINVVTHNDSKYYIPTWHSEVFFKNLHVICSLKLPSFIKIDEFNNIHIDISQNITTLLNPYNSEILTPTSEKIFIKYINSNTPYFFFNILHKKYFISDKKIFIKPFQTIILHNKGIPTILNSNIYSDKYISNIIIHLTLF